MSCSSSTTLSCHHLLVQVLRMFPPENGGFVQTEKSFINHFHVLAGNTVQVGKKDIDVQQSICQIYIFLYL